MINKAELSEKEKDFSKALNFYSKAFKLKKEYNYFNFLKAAKCAKQIGKKNKSAKLFLKAIETGCTLSYITDKAYLNEEDSVFKRLKKKYHKYHNKFISSIDLDTYIKLEKMEVLDQFVRTEEIFFDSIGMVTWTKVDSIQMEELISLTKKYGWLSPDKVGFDGARNAFLLLLHGTADEIEDKKQIDFFEPYLLRAIEKGTEHPRVYAILIDRYRLWFENKGQLYGTFNSQNGFETIDNIENIDKRRQSIGLESLKDYAYKKGFDLPHGYSLE